MTNIIKEIVNHKLKNLTVGEIMRYAYEYNFSLSEDEAQSIVDYFRYNQIDPFDKKDRDRFFSNLADMTNYQTARKAYELFHFLTKKYNVDHLFNN